MTLETPSTDRPQSALMFDIALPLCAIYFPLGFAIKIASNDRDVLIAGDECFGHIRESHIETDIVIRIGVVEGDSAVCPPEPTRREYNHLYSLVANTDNQALLDLKSLTNFAWLSKSAVSNHRYLRTNFLEKIVYLLLGARYVTDIHAACVSKRGKGILFCGDSGAGKSTLAYACARSGWTYVSDDTSYLINSAAQPRVTGHSHRVRFRPSARALFPELEAYPITPRFEGKPSIELPSASLPIGSVSPEAEIKAVVYLRRCDNARARLLSLPTGTSTRRMQRDLFSAGEIRAQHEVLLNKFWDTPTYELHYSDLDEAIGLLDDLHTKL